MSKSDKSKVDNPTYKAPEDDLIADRKRRRRQEILSQHDRSSLGANSLDPVKMYLRRIGKVELLTREGEVEIAKEIEAGREQIFDELIRCEAGVEMILALPDRLKAGTARAREVFDEFKTYQRSQPILNLAAIRRQGELIGTEVPAEVVERIAAHDGDPVSMRAEGIALAAELCRDLLDSGAPGLHLYTLNRSKATLEIFEKLDVRP